MIKSNSRPQEERRIISVSPQTSWNIEYLEPQLAHPKISACEGGSNSEDFDRKAYRIIWKTLRVLFAPTQKILGEDYQVKFFDQEIKEHHISVSESIEDLRSGRRWLPSGDRLLQRGDDWVQEVAGSQTVAVDFGIGRQGVERSQSCVELIIDFNSSDISPHEILTQGRARAAQLEASLTSHLGSRVFAAVLTEGTGRINLDWGWRSDFDERTAVLEGATSTQVVDGDEVMARVGPVMKAIDDLGGERYERHKIASLWRWEARMASSDVVGWLSHWFSGEALYLKSSKAKKKRNESSIDPVKSAFLEEVKRFFPDEKVIEFFAAGFNDLYSLRNDLAHGGISEISEGQMESVQVLSQVFFDKFTMGFASLDILIDLFERFGKIRPEALVGLRRDIQDRGIDFPDRIVNP